MPKLPKELNDIAKKAGVHKIARRTDLADAFARAEFTPDNMASYLTRQKERRPHWFKQEAMTDGGEGFKNPDGFKSKNPFAKGPHFSLAEQARLYTNPGTRALAIGLAKSAGITLPENPTARDLQAKQF